MKQNVISLDGFVAPPAKKKFSETQTRKALRFLGRDNFVKVLRKEKNLSEIRRLLNSSLWKSLHCF